MNKRNLWYEMLGQIAGMAVAILAVTAAAYLWEVLGKQAILVTYSISFLLMFFGAWIVFRRIVRRDYRQNGMLTPFPSFLQLLIWGWFCAFPRIYNPMDWAWSQSPASILGKAGWAFVWTGLAIVIGTMAWLGLIRSFGQKGRGVESRGPYRMSRNPQLMGGALLVVGYVLLWPSWYAPGWLVLFAAMAHLMILAEEEYLLNVYGEEYARWPTGSALSWVAENRRERRAVKCLASKVSISGWLA